MKQLLRNPPHHIPQQMLIENVPFFTQQNNYCGPSTLATVANFYGRSQTVEQYVKAVYVPGLGGSLQAEMSAALRHSNLLAYKLQPTLEALLAELAAGNPVIVLQNLGLDALPRWHYAVALGFDLDRKKVILNSADRQHYRLSLKTFAYTWARSDNWALVPLPAGKLPHADDPNGLFFAAVDYEHTNPDSEQATLVYLQALQRWPREAAFSLALSNIYYANANYIEATAVLLNAKQLDPGNATVFNNLAYSLVKSGCPAAASRSINCAVKLDTDPAYQLSKQQIDGMETQDFDNAACPAIYCD